MNASAHALMLANAFYAHILPQKDLHQILRVGE
jgi:hypothetical protein